MNDTWKIAWCQGRLTWAEEAIEHINNHGLLPKGNESRVKVMQEDLDVMRKHLNGDLNIGSGLSSRINHVQDFINCHLDCL